MATCMYCGSPITEGLKFCTSCGAALPVEAQAAQPVTDVEASQSVQQPTFQQPGAQQSQFAEATTQPAVNDSGSIGWAVLGFFIPIVGLILFLVWNKTKPQCAKMAGIGALIGFCLGLVMNLGFLH